MKKSKVLLASVGIIASCSTFAVGMPVFDFTAMIQMGQQIQAMAKQYEQIKAAYDLAQNQLTTLKGTYDNTTNQLKNLKALKEMNTKKFNWGQLKNTAEDIKNLKWSADSWNSTINDMAGGNSSRYKELLNAYKKSHHIMSDGDFEKGATKEKLSSYKESKVTTQNADTQATLAYNNVNSHHESIHEISKKIDTTENTKSSIDLNSRLVAENAQVQTEVLKQLTILNKQQALRSANDLRAQEEASKFNQVPEK